MSMEYNSQKFNDEGMDGIPAAAPIHKIVPVNCSHPCCYGMGHAFCFPCMKILVPQHHKPSPANG